MISVGMKGPGRLPPFKEHRDSNFFAELLAGFDLETDLLKSLAQSGEDDVAGSILVADVDEVIIQGRIDQC